MPPFSIRAAQPADLAQVYDIWYAADIAGSDSPPPRGPLPPIYAHERATGRMFIAAQGGRAVAFGSSVTRGAITFLTELFVRPEVQSQGIGAALLRRTVPADAPIRCTLASRDYRALALYTRAGMRPRWPNCWLRARTDQLRPLPCGDIEVADAQFGDPELHAWDQAVSQRVRPQDIAFWVERDYAVPLWFVRAGRRVGYGFVHLRSPDSPWAPDAATIGPVGARTEDDARDCVCAAVAWAAAHGSALRLPVPGPHPALAPLLEAGAQLVYIETFCSSADSGVADPRRYITSASLY